MPRPAISRRCFGDVTERPCRIRDGRAKLMMSAIFPSDYRCDVTIIDHHIVEFLSNLRAQPKGAASDVGKVLTDSLNRAQIQIGAQRAAMTAG